MKKIKSLFCLAAIFALSSSSFAQFGPVCEPCGEGMLPRIECPYNEGGGMYCGIEYVPGGWKVTCMPGGEIVEGNCSIT